MKTTAWYVYGNIEYRIALEDNELLYIETTPYVKPKKRKHHLRPSNNFIPNRKDTQNV